MYMPRSPRWTRCGRLRLRFKRLSTVLEFVMTVRSRVAARREMRQNVGTLIPGQNRPRSRAVLNTITPEENDEVRREVSDRIRSAGARNKRAGADALRDAGFRD